MLKQLDYVSIRSELPMRGVATATVCQIHTCHDPADLYTTIQRTRSTPTSKHDTRQLNFPLRLLHSKPSGIGSVHTIQRSCFHTCTMHGYVSVYHDNSVAHFVLTVKSSDRLGKSRLKLLSSAARADLARRSSLVPVLSGKAGSGSVPLRTCHVMSCLVICHAV